MSIPIVATAAADHPPERTSDARPSDCCMPLVERVHDPRRSKQRKRGKLGYDYR